MRIPKAGGALFQPKSLEQSLRSFYRRLLDVYYASDPPRGCLVFCTTPVESISHAAIAEDLRRVIAEGRSLLSRYLKKIKKWLNFETVSILL